jgi:NADH:ubiquinone oxidoreductase subunit C
VVTERRAPAARAPREEGKEAAIVPPEPGTVCDVFKEVFPHVQFVATQGILDVIITVPRDAILNVLNGARHDPRLAFDYLRSVCGVDEVEHREEIDVVYHLYSFNHKWNVTLKCPVPVGDPWIPSAIDTWIGADWHERETAEMFGIDFRGHPHLVPLLLEEGLNIHPLRKSHQLAEVEIKQGLDVYAFKEQFNWGGSAVGEEVAVTPEGTTSAETATGTDGAAGSAAPRKKLTPEELEAAKARAAAMRAEHEAKKAAGEFSTADRKKRYTPEEIAAIKAKAGVSAKPAEASSAVPAPTPAAGEAPMPEATTAEIETEVAPEAAAPAAAEPRRKLTPDEIEEVKKRAAAMRAEHAEKKARGEVSTEPRKKRYTPEEIEAIKAKAKGGG